MSKRAWIKAGLICAAVALAWWGLSGFTRWANKDNERSIAVCTTRHLVVRSVQGRWFCVDPVSGATFDWDVLSRQKAPQEASGGNP